jgi:hypothetical protein
MIRTAATSSHFACQMDCLVSELRALLRYLQKQQGAFLTLARNTHFAT